MTLILSASDLAMLADMKATIDAAELAFADITCGTAHQPAPTSLHLPSSDARFVPMTGLADTQQLAAVKMLADIPANRDAGLPTQRSTILLASQATGETLAILDGRIPTRVRTAAASAVASKHLARPDSRVLGLVGAGALAVAHVEAMLAVLPIEEVVVWSRSTTTTDTFREQVSRHGLPVTVAGSAKEVFASADVVCTLTPATEPIVHGRWFRAGQHINAVGSRPRPDHREIDTEGMARSRIFVDSRATAAEKSGDLLIPVGEGALSLADVQGELGEVVTHRIMGRASDSDITLFNSVGIGMLDLAIGRLMYDEALERGLGLRVDLSR